MKRLAQLIADYNDNRAPGEPPMTKRRLAEIANVHEVTVCRQADKDIRTLTFGLVLSYARALKVDLSDLVENAA